MKKKLLFLLSVILLFSCHDNSPEGVEAIDLGLPSGTKWANMNVGAATPEDYGSYYAWGETKEKPTYNELAYYHHLTAHNLDYGNDISGTDNDVAHVNWGGKWQMPTSEQIKELIDNCNTEFIELNGVKGCKFTSKTNGNSIFLPSAGYRNEDKLYDAGEIGGYWSATLDPNRDDIAHGIGFKWEVNLCANYRWAGACVRPVLTN